jgi:hypothetical protein
MHEDFGEENSKDAFILKIKRILQSHIMKVEVGGTGLGSCQTVSWLRWSVAGFSLWTPDFEKLVEKVTMF